MSAVLPSDEVALDFQDSLQDLQDNNRYEINNLTLIAKENTEHAQAISQVLEKHIRTTAPTRKLPALYVLDSIVKNVGTPYTVYLSRNLFSTFMDAYTLVDNKTRKALEATLKTWKEPVPGSMDPRPVFPPEVTRNIENALIKARTVAVQQQQQQTRIQRTPLGIPTRPVSNAFRNTPTPPQNGSRYAPPLQPPHQNGYPSQRSTPQPYANISADAVRSLSALLNPQEQEVNKLKADIQSLINSFRNDFAQNPYDTGIQTKLKALLDLQAIVSSQKLPPDAMGMIKAQLAALQPAQPPAPSATPSFLPTQQWQPPTPVPQPFQPPPQQLAPAYVPPPSQTATPVLPNFAPGVLEQLLKSTAAGQKPSTPVMQAAVPALQNMPITQSPQPAAAAPPPPPAVPAPAAGNSLLDALRAAGLVQPPATSTPASAPAPPLPSLNATPSILQQLQGLVPTLTNINAPTLPQAPPASTKPRISPTAPNLKLFRPHLIHALYDAQPNQCTTCGLRFSADDAGRAKKARHLDWHFRTNQRLADAQHKGQNRSWYIDELEWIRLRDANTVSASSSFLSHSSLSGAGGGDDDDDDDDNDDDDGNAARDGFPLSAAARAQHRAARRAKKAAFIPAPTGAAAQQNAACPICQDKFETVWHDEAQEWVWMDAVKVGSRVYHASCHREVSSATAAATAAAAAAAVSAPGLLGGVTAAAAAARGRSSTPDVAGTGSVLGKRKVEGGDDDLAGLKAKFKREVAA